MGSGDDDDRGKDRDEEEEDAPKPFILFSSSLSFLEHKTDGWKNSRRTAYQQTAYFFVLVAVACC